MPDILNGQGLTVLTLSEIVANLEAAMKAIYGTDINIDQNSPDGQMINIFAQACEDIRELLVQINNGFDPDFAAGSTLDQRVALNNIARQAGTFTIQPVDITVSGTVFLQGLDAAAADPAGTGYTIQDNAGNQFVLLDSTTLTVGTTTLDFRAKNIGNVQTTVDTITNPVTIVLNVTSVNNSLAALSIGQNEETDAQLRVRRQRSVALASNGYLNGLLGTVLALTGVVDAKLYENDTSSTDANGIPGHGMWLIVNGGANTDIANVIYEKKTMGANMKGAVSVPITTPSGAIIDYLFDRPTAVPLHIRFNIQTTSSSAVFDQAALKNYFVANLSYGIGDFAETASLTALGIAAINAQGGGGFPEEMEISSDGSTWVDYLPTPTLDKEWVVSTGNITITVIP